MESSALRSVRHEAREQTGRSTHAWRTRAHWRAYQWADVMCVNSSSLRGREGETLESVEDRQTF